jgi:hypothetical protein
MSPVDQLKRVVEVVQVPDIRTWVNRLARSYPISGISMELVKFDAQLMENPETSGVAYQ